MKRPLGIILYQGPSKLPRGGPIVVIATLNKSKNIKTGNMIQTYILRSDMDPITAVKRQLDRSICGNCTHRATEKGTCKGRTCYVQIGQGPSRVYEAFRKGRYEPYMPHHQKYIDHRDVRHGAYGDPMAAPIDCFAPLKLAVGKTCGYTQRWRTCDTAFRYICMASVTSLEEREEAKVLGWRTFRVKRPHEPVSRDEMVCPASWPGSTVTCVTCGMCSGSNNRRDIVINIHGTAKNLF